MRIWYPHIGFPFYPAWPFGPSCAASGGTLITNAPGISHSVSSTGSFLGFGQKLVITIPASILPGGSFGPGYTVAVSVETKFSGIGYIIPVGYFDHTNGVGQNYRAFIDTAKATIGSLEMNTQCIFRGYLK